MTHLFHSQCVRIYLCVSIRGVVDRVALSCDRRASFEVEAESESETESEAEAESLST